MRNIVKVLLFILLFTMLLTPVFAESYMTLASTDISVFEGKTYQLVPHHTESGASYSYASDNANVAPVDANGLIRAIQPGTAKITITENLHNTTKTVTVTVKKKQFVYAVYVPPGEGYATDEQYAYLQDAGMNTVIMHGFVNRAHMDASMAVGVPRGIQFYVSDDRLAGDIFSYSENTIRDYIRSYKDREGVYGYFLKDEPHGANPYAVPYRIMASEDPEKVIHLNFFPSGSVEQLGITYDGYIDDWVALCGPEYKKTISFDCYPFDRHIYNEQVTMRHFEIFRNYAHKHDVDFEYFIQSVDYIRGYYSTNESVRFHFSIGLAYGAKSYQYFTWFTPISNVEPYEPGSAIMTSDGKPGDLYDAAKDTNHRAQKVEPYLAPAEAIEVYHTGTLQACETKLPSNYFFRATNNPKGIFSLYYNEAKNIYYIFVVNKDYYAESSPFHFVVDGATEVFDLTSGTPVAVTLSDGKFSENIEGGLYRLYAFNEGFVPNLPVKKVSDNLALDKPVYVHTSIGNNGFYAMNLTDGNPETLWSPTEADNKLYALIDLKKIQNISYLTLQADANHTGTAKISISRDNYVFETIDAAFSLTAEENAISFPKTAARYIKIEIPNTSVRLAECKVYERMPIRLRYQNTYLEKGMTYLRTEGDFEDIHVVSALYENGVMTDVRILSAAEIEKGDTPLFLVTDTKNTVVKTFLLQDGIASLMPYAKPFDVKEFAPTVVFENFNSTYDSEFWDKSINTAFSASGYLTGFAYSFGPKNPVSVKSGYTFAVDFAAPYDSDKAYWMSAGITLRGSKNAASYNKSPGIMLLFQEDRMALRTKTDSDWNLMMMSDQPFFSLPFSMKTAQRIIAEDDGANQITLSYVDAKEGIVPFAYVVIDQNGATLYNANKTKTYGTAPTSLFEGNSYVSVFSHLQKATFDNMEIAYHEKATVTEAFNGNYDTDFWHYTVNSSIAFDQALTGFAFGFGMKNPINIEKGYTISAEVAAPYDSLDKNPWMSIGFALRATQASAPYNQVKGIHLFIQEDRIGLRTKISANWVDLGISMMPVPVSFKTARKIVLRDNGYDEIRIQAEDDHGELMDLGYIMIDDKGATLYNADKSKAYGTCLASLFEGESHVGVFQHLQNSSFDNLTLTYAE